MTMRIGSRLLLSALAALAIAAAMAQAQGPRAPQPQDSKPAQAQESKAPPNALQGFSQNKDQPVNIKSAALEVHDREKKATFTGNVHLVQGDTTLVCNVLVVFYDAADQAGGTAVKSATPGPTGSSQIRRMEAKGNVIVTQKDQTAKGDLGIYDTTKNTVTLTSPGGGKVSVAQGPNILRSPQLVVHLDTGISHFVGGVEALLIPKAAEAPPAATDAKAPPAPQPPPPKRPDQSSPRN